MDSPLTADRLAELDKIKRRAYLATKGQGSLLRLGETLLEMVGREAQLREALRRKCVLDSYGITIENLTDDFDRWLEIVSSDERLAQWFGEPLRDYVLSELSAVSAGSENG